jgi:hypothetical protein
MYTGATIDIGKGNLCANCHQTRVRNYGLELGGPDVKIGDEHWGPHYGTQSNYFTGNGGYEVIGSVAYSNSAHTTFVTDGCPTCHMVNGDHTLEPNIAACKKCHSDFGNNFDYRGVQTEIEGLLNDLKVALLANGLLVETDDEVHPTGDNTMFSADKAGALLNYLGISADGSRGIHNTKYIKALLTNSIEALQ